MSTLTSSPTAALQPGSYLLVGTDRDPADGSLRLHLGARHRGIHTHLPAGDAADQVEQTYAGTTGHLWLTDVVTGALCGCTDQTEPAAGRVLIGDPDQPEAPTLADLEEMTDITGHLEHGQEQGR